MHRCVSLNCYRSFFSIITLLPIIRKIFPTILLLWTAKTKLFLPINYPQKIGWTKPCNEGVIFFYCELSCIKRRSDRFQNLATHCSARETENLLFFRHDWLTSRVMTLICFVFFRRSTESHLNVTGTVFFKADKAITHQIKSSGRKIRLGSLPRM